MTDKTLIQISQERETPVQSVQRARFGYRYAYSRSADSRASGDPGQDSLVVQEDGIRLAFSLCDGVSQSFYGDLAARFLGNALVNWLWEYRKPISSETFRTELTAFLNGLVKEASAQVAAHPLPAGLPEMLRQVLEEKRALGSETTFIAGLLDTTVGSLYLTWMGDSRLRLWGPQGEFTAQLGDAFHTQERWSTRRGCLGEVHFFHLPLAHFHYLIAYSDGLARLDSMMRRHLRDQSINAFIEDALRRPESDDISFFECWLGGKRPVEKPPLPAPTGIRLDMQENVLKLSWRPLASALRYEVLLDNGESLDVFSPRHSCEIPKEALRPHLHSLRVRAWDDEPGEWSAAVPIPAEALPIVREPQVMPPPPPISLPTTPVVSKEMLVSPPARQSWSGPWVAFLAGIITTFFCLFGILLAGPLASRLLLPTATSSPFPTHLPSATPILPSLTFPPTETATVTPSPTLSPSPSPTPVFIKGCAKNTINVRAAPGTTANQTGKIEDDPSDQKDCFFFDMYTKINDEKYPLWLHIAPDQSSEGWVAARLFQLPENWENILPTLTPSPTPSSTSSPSTPFPTFTVSPTLSTATSTPFIQMTVYPPTP